MENSKREVIYLACPLSHHDQDVEVLRFKNSCMAAAYLMTTRDCIVFSPLSHSCPISHFMPKYHELTILKLKSHEFWAEIQDTHWMDQCDKLIILTLNGWAKSRGVLWENKYMVSQGKPVERLNPATVHMWLSQQEGGRNNKWI